MKGLLGSTLLACCVDCLVGWHFAIILESRTGISCASWKEWHQRYNVTDKPINTEIIFKQEGMMQSLFHILHWCAYIDSSCQWCLSWCPIDNVRFLFSSAVYVAFWIYFQKICFKSLTIFFGWKGTHSTDKRKIQVYILKIFISIYLYLYKYMVTSFQFSHLWTLRSK